MQFIGLTFVSLFQGWHLSVVGLKNVILILEVFYLFQLLTLCLVLEGFELLHLTLEVILQLFEVLCWGFLQDSQLTLKIFLCLLSLIVELLETMKFLSQLCGLSLWLDHRFSHFDGSLLVQFIDACFLFLVLDLKTLQFVFVLIGFQLKQSLFFFSFLLFIDVRGLQCLFLLLHFLEIQSCLAQLYLNYF